MPDLRQSGGSAGRHGKSTCVPVAAHKVGDTWSAGPYSVSLVAGEQ